ncbi:AraC family transcriptional regulator [Aestuariirhabdus sp. Z084]|uniref:helix-turn-helix domain-containing protein n=1 Tax=Aestuariirhabdus haliotis TaxID=2918751 RepID=UPI00201B377B|nr:AraC family transcriptional regulator [Aestuariirhabdus haliotis]MCL6415090.1 AraC family transcriptional regulator [Aestuariirhabdus haliotis]MCL6419022.1 AraC family transcriptional regulator [Aestuariirhabdus haliotis]
MATNHTTLSIVFKQNCGMAPMKWLRVQRMKKARYLVGSTRLCIYEIGNQVGYPSASVFTVAYKAHFNITPARDRKSLVLVNKK